MVKLCDVVNFNCDASCLDSDAWIASLRGGANSQLYRWLRLYVEFEKPVTLGFTGAALADISVFNLESLDILRNKPEIFQILWRPFAHDLPFFRTDWGFTSNVKLGRLAAQHLIGRVSTIYLPPEFMQTNRQTNLLIQQGVQATMIMASRFNNDVKWSLPEKPFALMGIPEGMLCCIPAVSELFRAYLSCIQLLDVEVWHNALTRFSEVVMWRDGESCFLIPDGIERERFWLEHGCEERVHLELPVLSSTEMQECYSYPVHPFSSWMNELSMLWFLKRIHDLEERVMITDSPHMTAQWLHCINSDILASVEKRPPVIKLRSFHNNQIDDYRIVRSRRAFEGEWLLEAAEKDMIIIGENAWKKKALAREKVVNELLG